MFFDVFFSISQTPVHGVTPSEAQMFQSFFRQVEAADALGFGVAWVAESHLSSAVQKLGPRPVIPHWQGEVGLNADIFQLAHQVFARTKHIEVGAAVMNLLFIGPIGAAERAAAFATLHGLDPDETRKLHLGFSAGRFDYMNRAVGIAPRTPQEASAWPEMRQRAFAEAAEIFVRLFSGETLSSADVIDAADDDATLNRFYRFERLRIVPQTFRRELVQLVLGSHDPKLQTRLNQWLPVQVFNLSITAPRVIEETHARMQTAYHVQGGPWQRHYMPRTTFVFVHHERRVAKERAQAALRAYWQALEGTVDPVKVADATDNALIGTPEDVAKEIAKRFHPEDRLMLWFDFFNHDCDEVIHSMRLFSEDVLPRVAS